MSRKASFFLFFSVFLFLFLSGCTKTLHNKQLQLGIWAAENELWDEAIFRWQKIIQENPGSYAAHNNLAVAYEKKGFMEEAKREYETALKLAPDNPLVKSNYEKCKENFESQEKKKNEKD